MSRVLTLRLPDEDADKVDEVAQVTGVSVAEVIRQSVVRYVDQVRKEPGYGDQMLARVEQLKRQAEDLAKRQAATRPQAEQVANREG